MLILRLNLGLALLLVAGLFSEAAALDAYRDRKGLLYGISLGGGSAKADTEGAKSRLGYNINLRLGGGINQQLTLDASLGFRLQSHDDIDTTTSTFYLGANYFIHDGLYARVMGGLAQFSVEGAESDDETGLGFGAGLGYEFFASAVLAVGVGADFQIQQFDNGDIRLINFGVGGTWY